MGVGMVLLSLEQRRSRGAMTAGSCCVRENVRPKGPTMVSSSARHAIGSCVRQAPRTCHPLRVEIEDANVAATA